MARKASVPSVSSFSVSMPRLDRDHREGASCVCVCAQLDRDDREGDLPKTGFPVAARSFGKKRTDRNGEKMNFYHATARAPRLETCATTIPWAPHNES